MLYLIIKKTQCHIYINKMHKMCNKTSQEIDKKNISKEEV